MTHEPPSVVGLLTGLAGDGDALEGSLDEAGIATVRLSDPAAIERSLESLACLVVTQEALADACVDALAKALAAQPTWAALPIIVLAARESDPDVLRDHLTAKWDRTRPAVLRRPVTPIRLLAAIHQALRARLRQFATRDQILREHELQRELHHRLQNLLATVQALASLSRRSTADDAQAFADFEARLRALASVHRDLDETGRMQLRFADVAEVVLAPYGSELGQRVRIEAVDARLTAEAAKSFALCLHELATNALKYGALSVPGGRVDVRFRRTPAGASLSWTETGSPPTPATAPAGFGASYVKMVLSSLFQTEPVFDFTADGLDFVIEGPANGLFDTRAG